MSKLRPRGAGSGVGQPGICNLPAALNPTFRGSLSLPTDWTPISCRKEDATGYFPAIYLQKAGQDAVQAQRQIKSRGAPPRRCVLWAGGLGGAQEGVPRVPSVGLGLAGLEQGRQGRGPEPGGEGSTLTQSRVWTDPAPPYSVALALGRGKQGCEVGVKALMSRVFGDGWSVGFLGEGRLKAGEGRGTWTWALRHRKGPRRTSPFPPPPAPHFLGPVV